MQSLNLSTVLSSYVSVMLSEKVKVGACVTSDAQASAIIARAHICYMFRNEGSMRLNKGKGS